MQFIKTLEGHLVNVEQITHVDKSGVISIGSSTVALRADELEKLEEQLSPKQLVEPDEEEEEKEKDESGQTDAPDPAKPEEIAEADKPKKPTKKKASK